MRFWIMAGLLAGWLASNSAMASEDQPLGIGSTAPALDIEHWVQNGADRFKPVTKFENGKVYVVEFWATWCGPCKASMPHLAELQSKYAEQGVQVISISDEDLETVEGFLKTEIKNGPAAGKTYDQVTKAYCLTTDPDGSSNTDYMEAAGQNGIPAAFIVGKEQKIEWIGHPMEMDEPLAKVVKDEWDRNAFAKEFAEVQASNLAMAKLTKFMRSGDIDEAVKYLDQLIADSSSKQVKLQFTMIRFQILLQTESKDPRVIEAAKAVYELVGDEPPMVFQLASVLGDFAASGEMDNPAVLQLAVDYAEKSVAKIEAEMKPALQLAIAKLHKALGHSQEAKRFAEKALEGSSGDQKREIESFQKELNEGK